MSSNFISVQTLLELPQKDFVQLKNGIKILLFSAAISVVTPTYSYSDVETRVATETKVDKNIEISLVKNEIVKEPSLCHQTEQDLYESLQQHRSVQMSKADMDEFWTVAKEVALLDFTDSMVCYEPEERQITFDILDKSGFVLHLTQYMDYHRDQVVYSIEKDADFILAGHTHINGLGKYLQRAIGDLIKERG